MTMKVAWSSWYRRRALRRIRIRPTIRRRRAWTRICARNYPTRSPRDARMKDSAWYGISLTAWRLTILISKIRAGRNRSIGSLSVIRAIIRRSRSYRTITRDARLITPKRRDRRIICRRLTFLIRVLTRVNMAGLISALRTKSLRAYCRLRAR